MKMIAILAKRDFTSRATRPAYIITTIIGVLVFVGLAFIPPLIEHLSQSMAVKNIDLVVYEQPESESIMPYLLQVTAGNGDIHLRSAEGIDEKEAYRLVLDEGLTGLLLINGPLFTLVTTDGSNLALNSQIEGLLNSATSRANAVRLGLADEDLMTLFQRVDLRVKEISPQGEDGAELDSEAHEQAMILTYFLLFMIYMSLILYGQMVASGVAEEKSSRIMEVMVSTVKPIELMFGKIIGVGALGLLQFMIWMGTALAMAQLGKSGVLSGMFQMTASLGTIPLDKVLWFSLYFLLGYFFYASIFAAAGALVSRVEEVGQVVTVLMMFIMVGFFAAFASFTNPNSSFAITTSLIPFTAPMVMFARIVLTNPPAVQIIASVAILLVSLVVGAWISAKIYRIGILLYGKRPSIRQVVSLLKD